MGRRRRIDRSAVLAAAEAVIAEAGAAGLTIDAVAARAGISKGGVLYCYPSKRALVDALLERDLGGFAADARRLAGSDPDAPVARLLGHVAATRAEPEGCRAKAASLLTAAIRTPGEQEPIRADYRRILAGADTGTAEGRRALLAFFAAEGMFLLRGLGFVSLPAEDWDLLLAEAEELGRQGGA
ncbi:TetR/AcrR family transcriptional regulator [Geminicoccus harenae]|uniref:TetR/AcrR family transcriptional regulator n=2 Tax=Geminicoccus harenae TaxID=2498453 RepID=UPI001C96509F|nr:TetR family transcriptional regulator [Geminicoccus harenae]